VNRRHQLNPLQQGCPVSRVHAPHRMDLLFIEEDTDNKTVIPFL